MGLVAFLSAFCTSERAESYTSMYKKKGKIRHTCSPARVAFFFFFFFSWNAKLLAARRANIAAYWDGRGNIAHHGVSNQPVAVHFEFMARLG